MKSFRMLNLPAMLLGVGAVLILSPACKAQESSPDHFTDVGVQDVYQPAPAKPAGAKAIAVPVPMNGSNTAGW